MLEKVSVPLVVDLDGTLTSSDSLIEALITVLLRKPQYILRTVLALLSGRAALKQYLASLKVYSGESLPLRPGFVEWLKSQRASGRRMYLVTAADQSVADAVAQRLDIFDGAIGSKDGVNLKGARKAAKLKELLPEGFAYAGNDRSDLNVWRSAASIVLVGASTSVARSARRLGKPVEQEFTAPHAGVKVWLRQIRIHQWAKNALLFVPLILAHRYTDPASVITVGLGVLCMSLVASATYIINDLSDLAADRLHRTKRNRPIAKGDISALGALTGCGLLGFAGLAGAFALNVKFALLVVIYIVLTLSYSIRLKAIALLDVFALGMLYTLRIFMGMVLIGAQASLWLLSFSLFFFFSLSMAKRHVEIVRAAERGETKRIKGRGYRATDAPLTLSLGIASSMAAVMLLFLYVVNDAYPNGLYKNPKWLWLISFLVFLWTTRVWLKSHRGRLDDDPVVFAIKDKPSWLLGCLIALVFALAIL